MRAIKSNDHHCPVSTTMPSPPYALAPCPMRASSHSTHERVSLSPQLLSIARNAFFVCDSCGHSWGGSLLGSQPDGWHAHVPPNTHAALKWQHAFTSNGEVTCEGRVTHSCLLHPQWQCAGCFLLRHSGEALSRGTRAATAPYTLSVMWRDRVRHVRIYEGGKAFWAEGESAPIKPYPSVRACTHMR